jgi:hypothetical protein
VLSKLLVVLYTWLSLLFAYHHMHPRIVLLVLGTLPSAALALELDVWLLTIYKHIVLEGFLRKVNDMGHLSSFVF